MLVDKLKLADPIRTWFERVWTLYCSHMVETYVWNPNSKHRTCH